MCAGGKICCHLWQRRTSNIEVSLARVILDSKFVSKLPKNRNRTGRRRKIPFVNSVWTPPDIVRGRKQMCGYLLPGKRGAGSVLPRLRPMGSSIIEAVKRGTLTGIRFLKARTGSILQEYSLLETMCKEICMEAVKAKKRHYHGCTAT